jgi:hypothetical protein
MTRRKRAPKRPPRSREAVVQEAVRKMRRLAKEWQRLATLVNAYRTDR